MDFIQWLSSVFSALSINLHDIYIDHFLVIICTHMLFFIVFWVGVVGSGFKEKDKQKTIVLEEKLARYIEALRKDQDKQEAQKEAV